MKLKHSGIGALLVLCSCGPSEAERHADFTARCVASKLPPAQCEIFYEVKRSAEEAKAHADQAAIFSAASMGK